jgi:hypothetical protein
MGHLLARHLRGGMPREDDWARTPSQPTVLCSTADQVAHDFYSRGVWRLDLHGGGSRYLPGVTADRLWKQGYFAMASRLFEHEHMVLRWDEIKLGRCRSRSSP